MTVSINTAFTSVKSRVKNIKNIDPEERILMANIVNSRIYDYVINVNPEDYISEKTIFVESGEDEYNAPSDFYNHARSDKVGIFKTKGGSRFLALGYDAQTGDFTDGLTVTGATSGATGVITQIQDDGTTGFLRLKTLTGNFKENEIITDTATGSATVNTQTKYVETDEQLNLTGKNSDYTGYFTRGDKYIFTPLPQSGIVYLDRYFPILTDMTGLEDTFVSVNSPDSKYIELIRDLLLIEYEINDQDEGKEINANERAEIVLKDFFNIKKEPKIYIF